MIMSAAPTNFVYASIKAGLDFIFVLFRKQLMEIHNTLVVT